jgi:hypothetical protein
VIAKKLLKERRIAMENNIPRKASEPDIEEFSIMELDDRLEFVAWNDGNCGCPAPQIKPS